MSKRTQEIKAFLIENVTDHPRDIVSLASAHFNLSRTSIQRQMRTLREQNTIKATGNTNARQYALRPIFSIARDFKIDGLRENSVWNQLLEEGLKDLRESVKAICHYGSMEMINNAIDHSEGSKVFVRCKYDLAQVHIRVHDDGVGIFAKLRRELKLDDEKETLIELSKGKFTTDPENHSGQGIYFTSRMFDRFVIRSGNLCFQRIKDDDEWFLETGDHLDGTAVLMTIGLRSPTTAASVFDKYSGSETGFHTTRVPVALAKFGDENLVSRSQARRVLDRFDQFKRVVLDFSGVETLGQAFADEIFRVYRLKNPSVIIEVANAREAVGRMIRHVQAEIKTNDSIIIPDAISLGDVTATW